LIAIVDYGMGNLASVQKALAHLHYEAQITSDPKIIEAATGVILPGVGAFAPAMSALRAKSLDRAVLEAAWSGKPLLGICLGMQLLFDGSEEGEPCEGLGLIPGRVVKFPEDMGLKVPQMGWNNLEDVKGTLLSEGDYVYFVHSYYCCPDNEADAAAYTTYGIKYVCAVERDNIFATQFHPEKSGEAGLVILGKFARRTAL